MAATPSFPSLSSEYEEQIMAFMDQIDCGIVCSTPLTSTGHRTSHRSTSRKRYSLTNTSIPLLDLPTTPDAVEGVVTTPITSSSINNSISVLLTPHDNNDKLLLSNWGLPQKILDCYKSKGISVMFDWQVDVLTLPGVLTGRNVLYSAPTSSGKTLVAELLSLKCILERQKKVLVVLPFVSIVHEKVNHLKSMFESVGIKVGGFMGSHAPQGGLASIDIAVCTIEKANSLVNRLLEERRDEKENNGGISQLGVVVVDELHMVGDRYRGYLLELLLTKLLHITKKSDKNHQPIEQGNSSINHQVSIQLIGMSASLPNLNTLAQWLDSAHYTTHYRPVPLKEMVKVGNELYDSTLSSVLSTFPRESKTGNEDEEDLVHICKERLHNGHSILIFCPTKDWCEKLSLNLARRHLTGNQVDSFLNKAGLISICEQLYHTPVGLDPILGKTLPAGIAFHHAGLTLDEREIIEGGYRSTLIKILVCTSTLSSGVNLPARLVIIRTPIFHQSLIDVQSYRQMIGRAGRKGIDEEGESILFCKSSDRAKVQLLLSSTSRPVTSCLYLSPSSSSSLHSANERDPLNRAVLEVVANGMTLGYSEILLYLSCTLLCVELVDEEKRNKEDITDEIRLILDESLKYLLENEFISKTCSNKETPGSERYTATQLGMATIASSLSPREALVVFKEFSKARRLLVLENELHMIYLVTPVSIVNQWPSIDWYKFYCIWERLATDMKHVASIIGVQEGYIVRALQGKPAERTQAQREKLLVHQRFFTCLVLHDLVKESGLGPVSSKYGASKGFLQSLQSAAGTFAGMVTVFCNRLGWRNMEMLLGQFQSRLVFGIEKELVDLVRISILNGARARILYNNGYTSLSLLARTDPTAIESVLCKAFPFKSKETTGAHWCPRERRNMSDLEAAQLIVHEARELLSDQLNVPAGAVSWDQEEKEVEEEKGKQTGGNEVMVTPCILSTRNARKELNNRKTDVMISKRLKLENEDQCSHELVLNTNQSIIVKPVTPVLNTGQGSSMDLFMDYESSPTTQYHCFSNNDTVDPDFLQLSSNYTHTCSGIGITDLSGSPHLLDLFLKETLQKNCLAFSVAVAKGQKGVGSNFIKKTTAQKGLSIGNEEILGVAFSWSQSKESSIIYYLSLCESNDSATNHVDPTNGSFSLSVPLSSRLQALSTIISANGNHKLVAIDIKKQIQYLMSLCDVPVTRLLCDPSGALWIMDPDSNEKTLSQLVAAADNNDNHSQILSLALDSPHSFLKSAAESMLAFDLMASIEGPLVSSELAHPFFTIESPILSVLAKLELNGIGFSEERCVGLKQELETLLKLLENKAFEIAGRSFTLSSAEDVERVLFNELKLESNPKTALNKDSLEKMSSMHPLPGLILEWRRLSSTLSRTVCPLLKSSNRRQYYKKQLSSRIYSHSNTHTATGRVIISDPGLQMIPKDFTIKSVALPSSSHPLSSTLVSVRDVFTTFPNGAFLSADYSQLELRILAHLSNDHKLCSIFNEGGDAFCKIAGEWFGLEEDNISDKQRQHTKQMCYGIIYGMSTKSLAEQLDVTEDEAEKFMDSFKSKYTGMSSFITTTVQECREKGYIKTLFGRKRFLPLINSETLSERYHAERQAVNSMIQGTASDLVKKAMISIDHRLHKSDFITYCTSTTSTNSNMALLVLQLHDELMYEVHENVLEEVARLVQEEMEAVAFGVLSVQLPVRLKVGKSWGHMEPHIFKYGNRED
ncbi:PREDICTED: DNA polymerase theta-like [Amphimedon queenslandica]|uniref:DNA polymerase theta n=2 Tax=Amphimedon queenslandica TaxID=400682 RepID=A0AAN0IB53_AMPQE|nr:PREDICTED: DNA polymerase theta-like [Amphimedon queenslandica]|eukprot:XP_003384429.2 PREDICTED: DNA polymerase theta-like [Amphimedon queenslandica]